MKKEMLEELIRKYESKLDYREGRLEKAKVQLECAKTGYEHNLIKYETLEKVAKDEAIQQDLYNMLYEIVEDLKEVK